MRSRCVRLESTRIETDNYFQDDWDASSEEEAAPAKPAVAVGSMRAKGVQKAKIAAKEEAERVKVEERAALVSILVSVSIASSSLLNLEWRGFEYSKSKRKGCDVGQRYG